MRPSERRRCPACQRPVFGRSRFCKARRCPHFAPTWARDQQRKVFDNLCAYTDGDGHAAMFTVTAPGNAQLAWDREHCAGLGVHKHSGLLGCRVRRDQAEEWNQSAPARWRRLHDRCARLTQRETGFRPELLARSWEEQRRGVLHVHAVVGRGSVRAKHAATVYARHLAQLAAEYGFGHVDTPLGVSKPARSAAAYISSYLTKGHGSKRTLENTVLSDELPRSIIHVSTRLTVCTGVTMRALRFRRLIWARWEVSLPFAEQATVQLLTQAFDAELLRAPPPQLEAVCQPPRRPCTVA